MNTHLSWARIDLSAFSHNLRELRRVTHPSAMIMAVVKANAYGHGAVEMAGQASLEPVDWLGVANMDEGISLRKAGISLPILIFGYFPAHTAQALLDHRLTPTVYNYEMAQALSHHLPAKKTINVHVKMDTGMGRLGLVVSEQDHAMEKAVSEIQKIAALKGIRIQGVYTHFADADSGNNTYTSLQLKRFLGFLDNLASIGITPEIRHAANSAAVIDHPDTHLDMVRPGISLYGACPSDKADKRRVSLKPVMAMKTKIIFLKQVPKGFKVSYNLTHETQAPTTIATIPIGYADGYNRLLSSKGIMLVKGKKTPVVGRVCMDLTLLDVGHIPNVSIGDEVVVFGHQGNETILVEDLANELNTISYEIFTRIGDRVKRVYI